MTTPELAAEIVRLHFAEHWRVGTIAAQLGVHADVVRRVLGVGQSRSPSIERARIVDPYRDFIAETLERYPRLRATRLLKAARPGPPQFRTRRLVPCLPVTTRLDERVRFVSSAISSPIGILRTLAVFTRMATRMAVFGSCSGQGKTTLARALAYKIGGTFVEFDALRHGPNWTVTPENELRAAIAPVVATERWTIDAIATQTLGRLVLDRVELIVWLEMREGEPHLLLQPRAIGVVDLDYGEQLPEAARVARLVAGNVIQPGPAARLGGGWHLGNNLSPERCEAGDTMRTLGGVMLRAAQKTSSLITALLCIGTTSSTASVRRRE